MSGGHLCEAEAPTEAAAETVDFALRAKLGGREKTNIKNSLPFVINPSLPQIKSYKGVKELKYYTIVGGVNGVGKSSFTGSLKAQSLTLGMIVDETAIEKINNCLENGYSFTGETTLSGSKTARTCAAAKEKGYFIRLYYIGLNTEQESIKRIKNRVEKGGHNIPEDTVRNRFNTRFESLKKVLPYCDEALFFDNDNGFIQVAEYRNGELIVTTDNPPRWLKELKSIADI